MVKYLSIYIYYGYYMFILFKNPLLVCWLGHHKHAVGLPDSSGNKRPWT